VLIKGYVPQNYLAIRIRCFHCGDISITPGLQAGEILPRDAVPVPRLARTSTTPSMIPRGAVLACEDEIAGDYALTRPRNPPQEPMTLSAATLTRIASEYDRLTGGRLAEHSADAARAGAHDVSAYPLAWALLRLREKVTAPGWSWLHENHDAIAAMYIASWHDWLACWEHYPRPEWFTRELGRPGNFLRTMAVFAAARLLFESGNHIGFSLPRAGAPDLGLHIGADGDGMALAIRSPSALQWSAREHWTRPVVQAAIADVAAGVQGEINLRRRGILILTTSILLPNFDQAVVDGANVVLQTLGRRNRGLAAITEITPKVFPVARLDQVGFVYGFYPMRNPHFAGENPIRVGSAQDFAAPRP
jgi:hypothetical protein